MKIRYLCVTLLCCGLFIYGAVVLVKEVAHKMSTPLSAVVADATDTTAVADAQPLAAITDTVTTPLLPETPVTPVIKDTVVVKNTVIQPVVTPAFKLDVEKIKEIQKKYNHDAPKQWGEHTSGVVRKVTIPATDTAFRTLFLTINAYGNHQEELTAYLSSNTIKATIFVSGLYAQRNGDALKRLSLNPLFDIQNLGNHCRSVSVTGDSAYHTVGTANIYEALNEVAEGAKKIQQVTGQWPVYFRPATGYIDNVAVKAINELGLQVIGYEVVTDGGGTLSAAAIKERILKAPSGSIIVISINLNYPNIFKGLQAALDEIKARNIPIRFEKLSDYSSTYETYR